MLCWLHILLLSHRILNSVSLLNLIICLIETLIFISFFFFWLLLGQAVVYRGIRVDGSEFKLCVHYTCQIQKLKFSHVELHLLWCDSSIFFLWLTAMALRMATRRLGSKLLPRFSSISVLHSHATSFGSSISLSSARMCVCVCYSFHSDNKSMLHIEEKGFWEY